MRRIFLVLLAAAAALPALAPAAAAQEGVERIRPGQTVAAALSARDPRGEERGYFRVYRFDAAAGRTYVLALRSEAFDAKLEVAASVGPLTDVVASDDDGGGGKNARVRFRPTRAGPYLAVVTAFQGDTVRTGAFELELKELAVRPAASRPLPPGDTVRGELGDESAIWTETDEAFDVYTFRGRGGRTVRAALEVEPEGAAVALLGRWADGAFQPIQVERPPTRRAAPRGPLANATDTFTISQDGEYAVAVATVPGGGPSRYTLRLADAEVARAVARTGRVAPGREERDTLRPSDPIGDGRRYREWTHPAAAGERIVATMRASGRLDSFLELGYYVPPDSFAVLLYEDDWEGRDARVTLDSAEAREYVIRAAFLNADTGAYTLRVDARPRVARRLQVGRIDAGREVGDSLAYSDAALELDGSPYDHWIYRSARAGERIVVTLTSTAFDPMLFVGRVENGGFREMWSNDDADDPPEGVRMSRVVAVLREPGDYVIRVNTFGPDESGPYRLKVERAP